MTRRVEIGYPIYEGMPVYPGLPEVEVRLRESLEAGDDWNGSVLTIYLHAGTHVDAPWHYMGGDAPGIDAVPIDSFFYDRPLLVDVAPEGDDYLVSVDDLKAAGPALEEADLLVLDTHSWPLRDSDFMAYATSFPALAPEAAEFIRAELPNVKGVAIDTLSIENIALGKTNGFRTHKALLDPGRPGRTICIYEDVNPTPIEGKELVGACCVPLRIVGRDARVCNVVVEVKDQAGLPAE